jgi:hypothetical protein
MSRKEQTRKRDRLRLASLGFGRFATSTPPFGRCLQRRAPVLRPLVPRDLHTVTCRASRLTPFVSLKMSSAASSAPNRPAPARESTGGPSGRFRGSSAMALWGWCGRYHSPSATFNYPTSTPILPWLHSGSMLDQCAL